MTNKLTIIAALTAALTPGVGNAIGLGEITLQSRIGETLVAEVPILATAEEQPVTACFSLAPVRDSELPVITSGKTTVIRRGQNLVLRIVGTRPISEPIFAIAVQAGCGSDIVRNYVLMPDAPFAPAETSLAAGAVGRSAGIQGKATEWYAREGETLNDIADAQAPANFAQRQRLLDALKRANPNITPDTVLEEGSVVRIPARKQLSAEKKERAARPSSQAESADDKPRKPVAPRSKPSLSVTQPTKGTDQVLLGAAPEDLRPRETGSTPLSPLAETEQRLLRLETTLHLLTQEVAKIDQALDLTTKAIEAQGKLQLAQTPPAPQTPAIATSSAASALSPSMTNWLELLLSAAAGAAISIGLAQYLRRRRGAPGDDKTALPPTSPPKAASSGNPEEADAFEIAENDESPSIAQEAKRSSPLSPEIRVAPSTTSETVETEPEDERSVLELAEIMLCYGRISGAAETLAEFIHQHMPQSIHPWSMLLDLYRRGGMRQEFEALADKMRTRFNASIPAWNDSGTPISGLKTLEDYPHVIQKTVANWGTQLGLDYLLSLVYDTRAGQRNGFPLEVVEEIALLMAILEDGYDLKRQR